MEKLNLPEADLKVVRRDGRLVVFDPLRRRFVTLTPEEWVRQHFVHFLITQKNYPAGVVANEVSITFNGMTRRCDTVVYGRHAEPLLIVEYKAPTVEISQQTFDQISRYNMRLHVQWLIVSNGLRHYCCRVDYEKEECRFVGDIPPYDSLL